MTLKEVREIVAESQHSEYLQGLTINIPYEHLAKPVKKTGITDIYRFFKEQKNGWEKVEVDLPDQLQKVKNHFSDSVSKIENFIKNFEKSSESALSNSWGNILNQIRAHQFGNQIKVLTYNTPELGFLLDTYKKYPESFPGAYDYLVWNRINNANLNNSQGSSANYMKGIILAYEFQVQDHTDLLQRRNNEKKSLGLLRSNFETYLSEAEKAVADYLKRTHDNFEEHANSIKVLEKKKDELFDQWFAQSTDSYQEFYSKMETDAAEMKELFRDGLRFAGPVKHWRERALKMKKSGAFWIKWLIGSSSIVALSLFLLLVLIPEGMTRSLFEGDSLAIKWAIVYVTFISFMVYAVRTFARLTFSSYHLSRDAEEREQLTHVYLALKKDGNVEEKDRVLILQSLFSRAETGLLKDDASPTLPGNGILNKISGSN